MMLSPRRSRRRSRRSMSALQCDEAGRGEDFDSERVLGEGFDAELGLERDPADNQARFDLALALLAKGDPQGAVDALLELFRRDREWNDGAAKDQLFKLFDSLGPKSELAQKSRRKLSSMSGTSEAWRPTSTSAGTPGG